MAWIIDFAGRDGARERSGDTRVARAWRVDRRSGCRYDPAPSGPGGAAWSTRGGMDAERMERERFLLALARRRESARRRKGRRGAAAGGESDPLRSSSLSPAPGPGRVEADADRLRTLGAKVIGANDPEMPLRLRALPDCPEVLFLRGDPDALAAPQIAIVGSRRATPSGAAVARRLAGELAALGLVVTSGLAHGIDAEAHRGALDAGGRTIAVLGSSLDRVYPAEHHGLADRIAAQGAVVTEFPFGTRPVPWNFPWRNRIISGLSFGVLVVEAAERSGSLITARLAAEQGREVFAVPGSILNPQAAGCHRLLRDGAKLVDKVEDILEELPAAEVEALSAPASPRRTTRAAGAGPVNGGAAVPAAGSDGAALLGPLDLEPISAEALAERAGLTPERVYSILLTLEIGGSVRTDAAGRYMRAV
ncbi:MAG: DNA-processing protein DprA [Immundisolibacterales bacterium]|nr:DNA-processing protein DprA [Immundisolibacterales bacterium]